MISDRTIRYYRTVNRDRDQGRGAFDWETRHFGYEPRVEVTVRRTILPAGHAAHPLLATFSDQEPVVVVRDRKMYADGQPVQLSSGYFPVAIAGGTRIEEEDPGPGGSLARLAELGFAPARHREMVQVRPPREAELEFFGTRQVLEILHAVFTEDGRAVSVDVNVRDPGTVLVYEWPET